MTIIYNYADMAQEITKNTTAVVNESVNVAEETTSVNNSNSNVMVEEKEIATGVAQETVAKATTEMVNAAENAASINQNPDNMERKIEEVRQTTRIAIINGEEKSIIVAHTDYGMEQPKDSKNLKNSIDRTKMLSCRYHFAKPDVFWKEGVELKDEENKIIEAGTENVLVLCPTADTYWRFGLEDKIVEPEIHEFLSVKDYAQAVGYTNLYSRGLSNTEKVGVAALATGNEACKTVFMFAKKHEMNITNAKLYLDCTLKPTTILEMTMGTVPEKELKLGRTVKDAEKLLEVTTNKLAKNAEKRYAIRAINSLLHNDEYTMKQILKAIKRVSDSQKLQFETAKSEEKQLVMSQILTKLLETVKQEESTKQNEHKEAA